jgi:WD40 repeat protein
MTPFNYYKLGGSLEYQHPTYVVRQADSDLYEGLNNGDLCYVLNSRQMGKSSLRVHIMKQLKEQGIQCASVDLTRIGSHVTPLEWYGGFVSELLRGFGLSRKVNFGTWWRLHEFLPPKQRLSQLIDDVLLTEFSGKIIIFIDEIDSILNISFKDDFFAFIRACYNQRADNPEYQRLTFCLLGVATPSDLIADKNRTPFNIGRAIALTGFELDEVEVLVRGLEGIVTRPRIILAEVLKWTGGQPFLTQKLCQLIATDSSSFPEEGERECVERLVQTQIIENWEAQDEPEHLRTIRQRLTSRKLRMTQSSENQAGRLLGLYQQILQQGEVLAADSPEQTQLRLTGLVVKYQGKLRVYNRIYAEIFNQVWLNKILANIRPYNEALNVWVNSNFADESRLLRGQTLQDAREWAKDKGLSDLERRFLDASQELEKRDIERRLQAEAEATQILTQANQVLFVANSTAKRRIQVGSVVLAIALIVAVFAGIFASRMIHQAQLEKIKSASLLATASFISEQKLDGLLEALKAGNQLKNVAGVDRKTQIQVLAILQRTVNFTKESNRFEGHQAGITGVAFSRDGNFLATVSQDKLIKIWSRQGKLLQTFTKQKNALLSLSFSPDGKLLATIDEFGSVKLWNFADGRLLKTLKPEGKSGWAASVVFSSDGQYLAASDDNQDIINIWSANQNWKLVKEIQDFENTILHLNYAPNTTSNQKANRQLLVSGNKNGTIKVWNSENGTVIKAFKAHEKPILSLNFSPDGRFLVTSSEENSVKIWNTENWQLVRILESHENWVNSVSFSPDSKLIATASDDNQVKIWRSSDGQLIDTLVGHTNKVYSVSFSPDSRILASAGEDKRVILWNLQENLFKIITNHHDVIKKMSISPDRKILATASSDKTVKLWSRLDGRLLQTLEHQKSLESISFHPSSEMIATASIDGTITLWQTNDGKLIDTWQDSHPVFDLNFSPDGETLATIGDSKSINIWDIRNQKGNGKLVLSSGREWLSPSHSGSFKTLPHDDKVLSISFSPNSHILASGSKDGTIKLWDKNQDWQLLRTLNKNNSGVEDIAFSSDSKLFASAGLDGYIKLWETNNGNLLKSFPAHKGHILSVNFSPNRQLIASAGEDGIVKIWQVSNGILLHSLSGHKSAIRNVIFLDNQILISVSAGLEKTIIFWNLTNISLDKLLKKGCNWMGDYLENSPTLKYDDRDICDGN